MLSLPVLGVFHAVGVAVDDDDDGVVQQVIEDADGGGLLVQEASPLLEGPLRPRRQRAVLRMPVDEL